MKHIKINDIVKDLSDIEGLVTDDSAYPLLIVKFPNGGHRMLSADKLTLVTNDLKNVAQMALTFLADLNGSEWIKGGVGELDMKQRSKELQGLLYNTLNPHK